MKLNEKQKKKFIEAKAVKMMSNTEAVREALPEYKEKSDLAARSKGFHLTKNTEISQAIATLQSEVIQETATKIPIPKATKILKDLLKSDDETVRHNALKTYYKLIGAEVHRTSNETKSLNINLTTTNQAILEALNKYDPANSNPND